MLMEMCRPPAWPGGSSWSPARVSAWASNWPVRRPPAGRGPARGGGWAGRLKALQAEVPQADVVTCDVTREPDRERLMDTVIERHGRIDGLVNNAGAGAAGRGPGQSAA